MFVDIYRSPVRFNLLSFSSSPFFATCLTIFQDIFITNVVGIFLIYIMALNSRQAEKIADDILSLNDEILSVSLRDSRGNFLAAKSTESFGKRFSGVNRLQGSTYAGSLTVAVLGIVNEVNDVFGEAQAIITLHKDCKLMLLPLPSYEVLVGLALERSAVPEDYSLGYKIEKLLAENVKSE